MKKILIIGDSSALPREELSFDKTYYASLKRTQKIILENTAKSNNSSYQIFTNLEAFLLNGYNPDIVILNYGIVDVFPRPYPAMVYKLLSCSGLLPYIDRFLKKSKLYYKFGDFFCFQDIPIKKFDYYSKGIIKKLLEKNVEKIIIIGIMKPYKTLLRSKRVKQEIELYNSVFSSLASEYFEVDYIDIYNDSYENFTIWDGYHYSDKTTAYLIEELEKRIFYD